MKDLRERLAAKGVHTLVAQFTDLHGVAKGKFMPLDHLDELLTDGAAFNGISIEGSGLPRTGPRSDYWARGYASTARPLPWMPGYARVVCDGFVEGEPYEACPRQVLRRAGKVLDQRGWSLRVGIEPEFFLLKRDALGWRPADDLDRLDNANYDLKSMPRQASFLLDLQRALAGCGLDVTQFDHEDAPGQYEVNFGFDEAIASADHVMLFKFAGHALAEARQMVFSMMPRPFADRPGSGMHFHVSLWQGQGSNARNLFVPHRQDGAVDRQAVLSTLGQQFAAGVLDHAAALCAIAAPTVNSYKRLQCGSPGSQASWAPACVSHGHNNRTALMRTLHDRFEWRLPDASVNPYLALATLIAAGLDGVDRALALPPAVEDDLYQMEAADRTARGLVRLPQDLGQALDALEADAVVRGALGPVLSAEFVRLKRAEHDAHAAHVSDWELERYAARF
jgi:glutamine synthetase